MLYEIKKSQNKIKVYFKVMKESVMQAESIFERDLTNKFGETNEFERAEEEQY